jgi:hypothetical protein
MATRKERREDEKRRDEKRTGRNMDCRVCFQ